MGVVTSPCCPSPEKGEGRFGESQNRVRSGQVGEKQQSQQGVRNRQTGRAHKHAVVAVANKLIHQAFAVIRQQAPFETRGAWSVST